MNLVKKNKKTGKGHFVIPKQRKRREENAHAPRHGPGFQAFRVSKKTERMKRHVRGSRRHAKRSVVQRSNLRGTSEKKTSKTGPLKSTIYSEEERVRPKGNTLGRTLLRARQKEEVPWNTRENEAQKEVPVPPLERSLVPRKHLAGSPQNASQIKKKRTGGGGHVMSQPKGETCTYSEGERRKGREAEWGGGEKNAAV